MKLCVALVCVLALLATARADQPLSADELSPSARQALLQLDPARDGLSNCVVCQVVLAEVAKTVSNATKVSEIVHALDQKCNSSLPAKWVPACEFAAGLIGKLLPKLDKLIYSDPYSPFAWCSMASICTVNCCETDSVPEQVHIALGNDPSEMSATWVTQAHTDSKIQFGTTSSLGTDADGESRTYKDAGWNGTIHTALMTGLQPNTQYFYRVGDGEQWSQVWSFRTLALNPYPLRLAVIGDMGIENSNLTIATLIKQAAAGSIDGVLHVGDISYADGFQTHWDIYMRSIEPLSARVPYMVVPGNHEIPFEFAAYKARFQMPGMQMVTDSLNNMYYSFNYGPMHVLGYSTESIIDTAYIDPTGKTFMQADLMKANKQRATQPWVMSMGHRPLYCSTAHHAMDCEVFAAYLRGELEETFYSNKVDVVFAGHVHNYERTYPVFNGKASPNYNNPSSPVYIVDGAAGNREGLATHYDSPSPVWSAARDAEFGFGHLELINSTTLQWTFYRDSDLTVRDQFVLTKAHNAAPIGLN